MDLNAPDLSTAPASSTMIDTVLRIGLVAVLVYACARIVLPFAFILMWSAILAVMLYPLHLRLATRLGDRGSALLIGLIGVAVILGPMVIVVTSLATSLYSLISSVQSQDVALPPPPLWLDGTPLVGKKLTEIWTLVATNLPAALTKYGHLMSGPLAWLASFAGGLAIAELSFVLSFAIAAVLVVYGKGATEFAHRLLERVTSSKARAVQLVTLTAATIRGVALGVIGVALIQSVLLGVGFFAIGHSGGRPFDACCALAGDHAGAVDFADAARRRLCLRDRTNAGGDHLSDLECHRRTQRQHPEAIDAGPGGGSAHAGHSDRCHRRHDRRWACRPLCRARASGRQLCAAAGMVAAEPGRWPASQ